MRVYMVTKSAYDVTLSVYDITLSDNIQKLNDTQGSSRDLKKHIDGHLL